MTFISKIHFITQEDFMLGHFSCFYFTNVTYLDYFMAISPHAWPLTLLMYHQTS